MRRCDVKENVSLLIIIPTIIAVILLSPAYNIQLGEGKSIWEKLIRITITLEGGSCPSFHLLGCVDFFMGGVSKTPGQTALTRICGACSRANPWVVTFTASFAEEYKVAPGPPCRITILSGRPWTCL